MRRIISLTLATSAVLLAAGPAGADTKPRVVLYNGVVTELAAAPESATDLWVTPAELTKATKFEVKPEGVCTERSCYPLPGAREKEFFKEHGGKPWFNFSEFARLMKMPAAHDAKNEVWYFGSRPEEQNGYLKSLVAPDFTLTDLAGKNHSLSDFRGKKVLLITWASW
jgi:hypothetical protein